MSSDEEKLLSAAKLVKDGQSIIGRQQAELNFTRKWMRTFYSLTKKLKPNDCNCSLCKEAGRLWDEYSRESTRQYQSPQQLSGQHSEALAGTKGE